jgi:SAM-dependent methyltransferase
MVDAARRGAGTRGLENVEYRVMDAECIDMADECVDGVLCRFGLMLMARPFDAARGARRILRPGGRFAYAVWGPPQENRWMTILGIAMGAAGHGVPGGGPFDYGGPFSLATPQLNRDLLDETGFRDIQIEKLVEVLHFDDFEDYWAVQSRVSGAMGQYLSGLTASEASPIREALRPLMAPFQMGTGYAFPSVVLGASGT